MSKLCLTNEILGAMTPKATDVDIKYALDSIDSEVHFVDNTTDEVNLTLPYYSGLERASSAAMSDDDLEEVAGGEVFVSILVIGITTVGFGTFVGVGAAASEEAKKGKNLDGSDK